MIPYPPIALILLNWNGRHDTLACLESIQQIDYPHFETILVDNGSTDGSVLAIQERFPEITLIQNRDNLGFAEGNNVGIRYALSTAASFIFLLNNDTLVDPQILKSFAKAFAHYPQVGILGAKIYLFEARTTLDHLGGKWNRQRATFDLIGHRAPDTPSSSSPIDYVCGAALIAKRELFETIGLLEPKFFLIWEEADLCFRARRAGFETRTCPDAKIWHKVSASFVGKPHSTYFWWRNRLLWIERNCPLSETLRIWLTLLLPEIFHMLKIRALKSLQLRLLCTFRPHADHTQRIEKLLKNKAALAGIGHYLLRRFGPGPSWLFQPLQKKE